MPQLQFVICFDDPTVARRFRQFSSSLPYHWYIVIDRSAAVDYCAAKWLDEILSIKLQLDFAHIFRTSIANGSRLPPNKTSTNM